MSLKIVEDHSVWLRGEGYFVAQIVSLLVNHKFFVQIDPGENMLHYRALSIMGQTFASYFKKNKKTLNQKTMIHIVHALPRVYFLDMLKRKGLPMATVQYFGRGHRPTPAPVIA